MFCVEWRIKILPGNVLVVLFQPFESVSRVVIINHAFDLSGIVVEVAKSSAHVVGLDIMQVNVIADGGGEEGEELADVL